MTPSIALVGSGDRQLERLLHGLSVRLVGVTGPDLASLGQADAPDVLVIDLRNGAAVPPQLAAVRRQHPLVAVIVVVSALDPAVMLDAMRAGANECVAEPLSADALESAIARVLHNRTPAAAGRVYGVIGSKGGVGATTVAVNLATALARDGGEPTLLIDLHPGPGDAAVFLGAEPRFSVVDALENAHRLDQAFFRSLVVRSAGHVDLLASPDQATQGTTNVRGVRALLEFSTRLYSHVVIDLPRQDGRLLDALDPVTHFVVVLQQELAAVRNGARLVASLRRRYGADKVMVVINRLDPNASIAPGDVERATDAQIRHTFPDAPRQAAEALNSGRPIVAGEASPLASSLRTFAARLAGLAAVKSDRPRGLLDRLAGRR